MDALKISLVVVLVCAVVAYAQRMKEEEEKWNRKLQEFGPEKIQRIPALSDLEYVPVVSKDGAEYVIDTSGMPKLPAEVSRGRVKRQLCPLKWLWYYDNYYHVGLSPRQHPTTSAVQDPHDVLFGSGNSIFVNGGAELLISVPEFWYNTAGRFFYLCFQSQHMYALTFGITGCRQSGCPLMPPAASYLLSDYWLMQTRCFPIPTTDVSGIKQIHLTMHEFFGNVVEVRNMWARLCTDSCW